MTQTTTFPVPQIVQAQFQRVELLETKELETIRKEAMQYNVNRIPGKTEGNHKNMSGKRRTETFTFCDFESGFFYCP